MTSREKPDHRIAILVSGRGSNMLALARACASGAIAAGVAAVVSDVATAPALAAAASMGIEALHLAAGNGPASLTGPAEAEYIEQLQERGVTLVCLAGFMRILRPRFLAAFPDSILNVHPSLLPEFPGLHAIRRAWESGARTSGATVHFVNSELDAGPIVMQQAVPIEPGEALEALQERIHRAEHEIYPRSAALFCEGRLQLEGRHVRTLE